MKQIKCAHCGHIQETETVADGMTCPNCGRKMVGDNVKITDICVFCGKEITPHEVEIFCPDCGKEYHVDCWIDNDGCGTKGCSYQDFLAPMEVPSVSAAASHSASGPAAEDTGAAPRSSGPATVDNGIVKSSEDGDVFAIPTAAETVPSVKKEEDAILNERMKAIRKREEQPEEKKISIQDIKSWANTPRDTKYDFDGKWFLDPYLLKKAKNYFIFLVGGFMGGAVLGVSLVLIFAMMKYIFLHTGTSWFTMCSLFWMGVLAGCVSGVYFAYRTMAALIDN